MNEFKITQEAEEFWGKLNTIQHLRLAAVNLVDASKRPSIFSSIIEVLASLVTAVADRLDAE